MATQHPAYRDRRRSFWKSRQALHEERLSPRPRRLRFEPLENRLLLNGAMDQPAIELFDTSPEELLSRTAAIPAAPEVVRVAASVGTGTGEAPTSEVAGVGDFDGDGTDDLLLRNPTTGRISTWIMHNGAFQRSSNVGVANLATAEVAGVGDFDADGTDDVLFRDPTTGRISTWIVDNGAFQRWSKIGVTSLGTTDLAGVGDFDADGTDDLLFLTFATGRISTWIVDNGAFQRWSAIGITNPATSEVAGAGDFDGDGTDDLLLRNSTTDRISTWIVDNGAFQRWSNVGIAGQYSHLEGIGDLDADGTDDLLFRDFFSGRISTWIVDNGAFQRWSNVGTTASNRAGVGDFDGDGTDDLLLHKFVTGEVSAWIVDNGAFQRWSGIGISAPVSGSVDSPRDVDMYRFTVTAGQSIRIDIDCPSQRLDSWIRLFDSSGTELASNDDGVGPAPEYSAFESYLEYTLPSAGTYYLGVSGYNNSAYNPATGDGDSNGVTGPYTINVSVGDPNDQISEAIATSVGSTVGGTIDPTGTSPDPRSHAGDVDMYRFTVWAGQRVGFDIDRPSGSLDSRIRLFGSGGTQLAQNDDGVGPAPEYSGLEAYLEYTFSSAGTYYLGVSGYPNNAYSATAGTGDVAGSTGLFQLILQNL